MFYPEENSNPDINSLKSDMFNLENENNTNCQKAMMKKIQETDFAIIDLNLFLDTHPECEEALELLTKLCATSKSLKKDYQKNYGPLYVENTPNNTPFQWIEATCKWPWE